MRLLEAGGLIVLAQLASCLLLLLCCWFELPALAVVAASGHRIANGLGNTQAPSLQSVEQFVRLQIRFVPIGQNESKAMFYDASCHGSGAMHIVKHCTWARGSIRKTLDIQYDYYWSTYDLRVSLPTTRND